MRGNEILSEDLYKTIKKLSEINAITKTEIARITGTSVTTVGRVRQTANYEEYKERRKKGFAKEDKDEEKKGLTQYQQQMLEMMKEQNRMIKGLLDLLK